MGVKKVSSYCYSYRFVLKNFCILMKKVLQLKITWKAFSMLFYNKSLVLNEVFLMAFPRMLTLYILSKVKNLEKGLANEKHCWATERNGLGCSLQKPWGKIIYSVFILVGLLQPVKSWRYGCRTQVISDGEISICFLQDQIWQLTHILAIRFWGRGSRRRFKSLLSRSLSCIYFAERNKRMVICSFCCSSEFSDAHLRWFVYIISCGFLYCLQDTISKLQQESMHEIWASVGILSLTLQ